MKELKIKGTHKFYDYYEKENDTNRLAILMIIFAFVLCPPFAFVFKWAGSPPIYFYVVFSATFIFPLLLLLEKFVPFLKNRLPILYFIYFNLLTFFVINDLAENNFNLFDFAYFIGLFSLLNFAIQRFYYSLIYFINTFILVLFSFYFLGNSTNENFTPLFTLFSCIGVFYLFIYRSRNKMINSIEDHNKYLKRIVNNIGNGIVLFQIRGNFINVVDFNQLTIQILNKEDIDGIENVFSNLFDSDDINNLINLNDDSSFIKEVSIQEEQYLEIKFTKIELKNGSYYIATFQDVTEKKKENLIISENEKKYKNLFIRNQTGIFTLNIDGNIIDCNPAFLDIFKKDDFKEIKFFPDVEEWNSIKKELLLNEKIINYNKSYQDDLDNVFYLLFRFYYDFEKNQIEGNVIDTTEITINTEALKEKENLYRLIYEESNDSILLLDDDRIIQINQKGLELLGKNQDEIIEKSFWDFTYNQSPDLKKQYDNLFKSIKEKKQAKFNWFFVKENNYIEAQVSIVALSSGGKSTYQCVIRDETERNLAFKSLENSKKTFESIIENTPEGFIILKNNKCLYVNKEFFKIFNIESVPPEHIEFDESFFGLNYPKFLKLLKEHEEDKLIKQKQLKFFINSKSVEIDLTIVSIIFNNEEAILLILKDVSFQVKLSKEVLRAEIAEETNKRLEKEIEDRKSAELKLESEYLRTKAIFDSSQNTLLITLNPNLKFSSFNQQSKVYFDYQTKKSLELNLDFEKFFDQIISPIKLRYFRYLVSGLRKGKSYQLELKMINIYNEKIWLEIYLNPIKDVFGNVTELSIVAHDITVKKKYEKDILKSLKEKEVLLKEVHHRVKNNLQIISSILNLQSSYIDDEKVLTILEESRHRIRSMAIIHENLYQTTNFSSINFKNYSRELVRNLISSYQYNSNLDLTLVEDVELVELSLDQAIPCGLIINELITNSMKYAFQNTNQNQSKGSIFLELKEKNNRISLIVGDNGVGLPKNFDIKNSETLGLQLVITLVEQLDGDIKIENIHGIKYFINFEKQKL
jgi:PAS domain S-box-containing protein